MNEFSRAQFPLLTTSPYYYEKRNLIFEDLYQTLWDQAKQKLIFNSFQNVREKYQETVKLRSYQNMNEFYTNMMSGIKKKKKRNSICQKNFEIQTIKQ